MTARTPIVAHLDMDAFYVSVERLLDPSLEGKPVVVGGSPDGRGVVCSASYEARRFGVRSAMPASHAVRLCPDAVFVRGDYGRYGEYSARVRAVLERFTPTMEVASQDEAYLDLAGTERLWGAPPACFHRLREAVTAETGLPCSVGGGTRKYVAKIASGLCKPRGLLWVPAGSEAGFLGRLPVGRMPGVGPRARERLAELGLVTLGQVQQLDPADLERMFGSWGRSLALRCRGMADSAVTPRAESKSISHEVTFETDERDGAALRSVLSDLAERVAVRLRAEALSARTVVLKYRYAGFETHTASQTLSLASQDDRVLFRVAAGLLESRRDPSRALRLLGLAAANLAGDEGQMDFFESGGEDKARRLSGAVDALRERYGHGVIRRAASRDKSRGQWG